MLENMKTCIYASSIRWIDGNRLVRLRPLRNSAKCLLIVLALETGVVILPRMGFFFGV